MNKSDIIIKSAEPSHLDEIMSIETRCFPDPWSAALFMDEIINIDCLLLIAVLDDQIIGFGGWTDICGDAHITNLAVDPDWRGRGVGALILTALIHAADEKGIKQMTLEVRVSNQPAIGLYQKYGFQTEGIRRHYYNNNGEDALIMWKRPLKERET